MDEEEAKLSVGNCLVKGISSLELKKITLLTRWKAEEFDEKLDRVRSKTEKRKLLEAKAEAVAKMYYENLANMIVEHSFKFEGLTLAQYLGTLSDDDVQLIEKAGSLASSITKEEQSDLSPPSETENNQDSKETVGSGTS